MPVIDSTARVAGSAQLADDVEIGPYCIVGPQVELKSGVRLISHASIAGVTTIGERATVYPFVSLGTAPQSVGYRGEPTKLTVGNDCQFREGVTVSTGTVKGGGVTAIGDRCFMMANAHVAHDCSVGHNVTFANSATLAGHVLVGDNVFIGGLTAVHQFNRIGEGAMVAGAAGVSADIIPFGYAIGPYPARLAGINVIGLRRGGHARADIHRVRKAYRLLFHGKGLFAERLQTAQEEFAADPLVLKILDFVRAKRPRQLMMATEIEPADSDDEI